LWLGLCKGLRLGMRKGLWKGMWTGMRKGMRKGDEGERRRVDMKARTLVVIKSWQHSFHI
jgi:hypothetical protein